MGFLSMTSREKSLYLQMLSEAGSAIGVPCEIRVCLQTNRDLNNDPRPTYSEPVSSSLFFEANPRPVLLKYNWLKENEELPYVAYINRLTTDGKPLDVTQYSVVTLVSDIVSERIEKFQVANIRGTSERPLMWLCSLVPYREQADLNPLTPAVEENLGEDTTTGYSYLKKG